MWRYKKHKGGVMKEWLDKVAIGAIQIVSSVIFVMILGVSTIIMILLGHGKGK